MLARVAEAEFPAADMPAAVAIALALASFLGVVPWKPDASALQEAAHSWFEQKAPVPVAKKGPLSLDDKAPNPYTASTPRYFSNAVDEAKFYEKVEKDKEEAAIAAERAAQKAKADAAEEVLMASLKAIKDETEAAKAKAKEEAEALKEKALKEKADAEALKADADAKKKLWLEEKAKKDAAWEEKKAAAAIQGNWHWPGPKGTDDDPEASPGPEAEAEAPEDNAPEPPKKEKKDWDAEKAKKDAAWEAKKAPEKAPVPVAAAPASSEETGRAQVLVVVSDHGSGTSTFGKALQTHPCMFDLGETFTANYPWSSTKNLKACGESQDRSAIFDAESGLLLRKSNDQLSSKFASSFDDKEIQVGSKAADGADPSLYANLPYDLGEYFVRMRDLICKNVPEKMCAPSECSITVKMFPQFFDGTTGGFSDAKDKPSECTIARNDAALKAWKKELASMTANPKVATLALIRYERDRQFSTFHRFTAPGTKFDCSFPRKPYDFAVVANQVADGHIQIENCWTGAAGAAECLKNALSLVGLTPELMGDKGTTLMTGGTKESISSKASSCSTDPDATFVSEKNDEVKMIHGELTTFYYVKMVANVDEDEEVASPSPEAREA